MSFSFGTPTTNAAAAPATGGFSFGARPATSAPPPAFGAATATSSLAGAATAAIGGAAPNFSFNAGQVGAAPTLSFGSPAATAAAPASTGLALPAFGGTTAAAAPAFGAPAAAPAFGAAAPAFGATAAPAFGATTAAPAFGAATAAPAFGAATAAPAFGAPATSTAFGAPAAAPAFGTTAVAPAFGATTSAPAFGAPAASSAFGAPAPAFGTATATVAPSFSFSTPATSAPTTAPPAFGATAMPTLGTAAGVGAFSFNKPQATTAASLNFNTTTTTATAQPFNASLRLGGTNTLAAAPASGGIFGKPLTTGAQPAAAAPAFVGLGGIDVSATQPKLGDNKQDGIKIKETQVPDEIVKTVDALKAHIKQQKTISSDIGRTSTSKLSNVSHEITNLRWLLQNVANTVDANNRQIKQLRSETAKAIQSLEMAQRTQDTPAGLQFENSAPFQYFQCLVAKYEEDLIAFRQQIALTESHMHALANPQSVSPEDLKRGFRQINESFVSLAGRQHELHQRVEEQKEHYLNLRRYRLRDATNVFASIDNPPEPLNEPQRISSGPTPFSNISAISTLNKSYASASAATSANATASKSMDRW
ncbi:nuclear pore complex protein Nup58 [Drosophila albomicans]|uniref:Nuclear pore complex protein Nup58 n=1 Tax=Drosophila albomicans TaxID=7291 RepID=A0A6P8XKN2_DROAB|nr:nuclear pore complex protein Nup58 [Drosophila albomicans]